MDVLAAAFDFPEVLLRVKHAAFTAAADDALGILDHARQCLLQPSATLWSSLHATVSIGTPNTLHVFRFTTADDDEHEPLRAVELDDLDCTSHGSFIPSDLPRALADTLVDALSTFIINTLAANNAVHRLGRGFVLLSEQSPAEWYFPNRKQRSLPYCDLQLYLTSTGILVHPVLQSSSFHPIVPPISPGSPLILLPYGTPAYFLATYSGPSSALTTQFREALQGHGVSEWRPSYVVAWVPVENSQGEDKGVMIVYPSDLALSAPREPLQNVPELPEPLQQSPQPQSHTPQSAISPATSTQQQIPSPMKKLFLPMLSFGRARVVDQVAAEVSPYVDSVARERERERDRLRRERDAASATPVAPTPDPAPPPPSLPTPAAASSSATPYFNPQPTTPQLMNITPSQPQPVPQPVQTSIYPSPPTDTQHGFTTVHQSDPLFSPASSPTELPSVGDQPMETETVTDQPEQPQEAQTQPSLDSFDWLFGDMGFDPSATTNGHREGAERRDASGSGSGMNMNTNMDYSFSNMPFDADDFTADDFSFFDGPAGPSAPVSVPDPFVVPTDPTPTITTGTTGLTPAGTSHTMETPIHEMSVSDSPFQFLMPSPASTHPYVASTHPYVAPTPAPAVQLASSPEHPSPCSHGEEGFDPFKPIKFRELHDVLDGKYKPEGKFAAPAQLPSPPYSEDEEPATEGSSCGKTTVDREDQKGIMESYRRLTDPSRGLIRKLIGVKRKRHPNSALAALSKAKKDRTEEWLDVVAQDVDCLSICSSSSSSSSDSAASRDNTAPYRPQTPLPAYLPPGPSLVATQFAHAPLLRLSMSNSGSKAGIDVVDANDHAMTYATPVSPGSPLAQQSRFLEAAANVLFKEIVDGGVWGLFPEAFSTGSASEEPDVWPNDVRAVLAMLQQFNDIASAEVMSLEEIFKSPLKQLTPPSFVFSKPSSVSAPILEALPPSLRFWEKLGLGPRAKRKDITVRVLHEAASEDAAVEEWMREMASEYKSKHLGEMTFSGSTHLKFDQTVRKLLTSFVTGLQSPELEETKQISESTLVLFVVVPEHLLSLSSPILRQILFAIKKCLSTFSHAHQTPELAQSSSPQHEQLLFHLIPDGLLHNRNRRRDHQFVVSVYDRILTPVERAPARKIWVSDDHVSRRFFQSPAYVLSRPLNLSSVKYAYTPTVPLDVVDRHMFLHVGYTVSENDKWLLSCAVDEWGESHELCVWLIEGEGPQEKTSWGVKKVWEFATLIAAKASVEWRVVISKLGEMSEAELGEWASQLHGSTYRASIVAAQAETPWTFMPPKPNSSNEEHITPTPSAKSTNGRVFVDVSSTTYALYPPEYKHIARPPSFRDADMVEDTTPGDGMKLVSMSLASSALLRCPSSPSRAAKEMLWIHLLHSSEDTIDLRQGLLKDITKSFYALSILANERMSINTRAILPFHLGAVDAMNKALDLKELELGADAE